MSMLGKLPPEKKTVPVPIIASAELSLEFSSSLRAVYIGTIREISVEWNAVAERTIPVCAGGDL